MTGGEESKRFRAGVTALSWSSSTCNRRSATRFISSRPWPSRSFSRCVCARSSAAEVSETQKLQ